jgi:hypothetical protein
MLFFLYQVFGCQSLMQLVALHRVSSSGLPVIHPKSQNSRSRAAIVLLGSIRGTAVIVLYPEGLNQHPGDALGVFRIFLIFGIPIGFVAYLLALWVLLVGTLIRKRRTTLERHTLQAVFRAAIPIGAAFALIWIIPGIVHGAVGGVLALSLIVVMLVAAVVLAGFMMRRCRLLGVSRPFSDSWWVLVLTVPLFIGMAASISSARENAETASRERMTGGIVTAYEPANYNLCRFTFAFLGRTFEGASRPPSKTPTVGQHVTVFFDTNHPQTNSLEDFASASRRQMEMVPFCLIAICAVIGTVVFARRRQSRTANRLLNS